MFLLWCVKTNMEDGSLDDATHLSCKGYHDVIGVRLENDDRPIWWWANTSMKVQDVLVVVSFSMCSLRMFLKSHSCNTIWFGHVATFAIPINKYVQSTTSRRKILRERERAKKKNKTLARITKQKKKIKRSIGIRHAVQY